MRRKYLFPDIGKLAINPELSKYIKKAVRKAFDSIQKEFDEL